MVKLLVHPDCKITHFSLGPFPTVTLSAGSVIEVSHAVAHELLKTPGFSGELVPEE